MSSPSGLPAHQLKQLARSADEPLHGKGCRDNQVLWSRNKMHRSEVSAHRLSTDHSQNGAADSTPPVLPAHTHTGALKQHSQDASQSAIPSSHTCAHSSYQPVTPAPSVPHAAHRLPQLSPHVYIQAFYCHKEKEGSKSRKKCIQPSVIW